MPHNVYFADFRKGPGDLCEDNLPEIAAKDQGLGLPAPEG